MPKIFADSGMHNLALNILDWFSDYIFFDRLSYLEAIRSLFQIFFLENFNSSLKWKLKVFRIFVFTIFWKKKILHCVCIACHKRMTISPFLLWLWHFSIIGGPEMPLRHAQFLLLLLIATAQWSQIRVKVEIILKGCLDSIPSSSPSVKIQIMGGKVCLRSQGVKAKHCWALLTNFWKQKVFWLITSS